MRTSPVFPAVLAGVFAVGVGVLVHKLYEVQVDDAPKFREDQEGQSTRRLQTAGRRGRILDARGLVLADARAVRNIVCRMEAFKSCGGVSNLANAVDAAIDDLSHELKIPRTVSHETVTRHLQRESPMPLVVFKDVDDRALARFEEGSDEHPGFEVETSAKRIYPYGSLAIHVLGYTGIDNPNADTGDARIHYSEKEPRGRAGLEQYYDKYLAGAPGAQRIRVDARGFVQNSEADIETEKESEDGLDLRLTLDARVQFAVERELRGTCGAGIVLDPNSGAVMALASAPAYEADECRTRDGFAHIMKNPDKPLLNRAISGLYAPGSTFKPIVALTALEMGWDPDTQLFCDGAWRKTRCTSEWGHGALNLRSALEKSCNPFFLQLGEWTKGSNVLEVARDFGLGERTGIDLYGESRGTLGEWHFQSAMGQGPILVTPLQMAVVTAAIANGGKVYSPFLHAREGEPPEPVRTLDIPAEHLDLVRQGMRDVVESGSARKAFHPVIGNTKMSLAVKAAGKTGSAEVRRGEKQWKNTWFVAFAPFDKPTVAIAMLVEKGEYGGSTVAPKVYNILKELFGEKEAPKL